MIIKSFGCSFIYGTDLSDNPTATKFSQLTWPALMAKKLNADYECYARPGSGNLQIADRVLNESASKGLPLYTRDAYYVINWTWIDRFDYVDPYGVIKPDDNKWQSWNTLRPSDSGSLETMYYKNLHSEYRDKLKTLITIKSVINHLIESNIKFMMTYQDELIFDRQWNTSPGVMELQDYVRPHMTTFEGKSFLEWSRAQGFEISPTLHPLDEAHAHACEYISNLIFCYKQNTDDPAQQAHV